MKKNLLKLMGALLVIIISFSGCIERRYYRTNHRHSPEYSHRHHMDEHSRVEVEIHN